MPFFDPERPTTIIQVGDGFPGADFRSLAEAVEQAPPGSRIVIGPGVYRESLLLEKPLEIVAAELEAGYGCDFSLAEVTRRQYAAVKIVAADAPAVIVQSDQVMLRGLCFESSARAAAAVILSDPWIEDCRFSGRGELLLVEGEFARPTLRACLFCDSFAPAAVRLGGKSQGEFSNCLFRNNAEQGMLVHEQSSVYLTACKFENHAVAVEATQKSALRLELCELAANSAAGVQLSQASVANLSACRVYDNAANGINVGNECQLRVEGCDIQRNGGAGILLVGSRRAFIRRLRIHRNQGAGIVQVAASPCNLQDCHLTDNAGGPWQVEAGCQLFERENYCDVLPYSAQPLDPRSVECPFCMEAFTAPDAANCFCPVCGWCFAVDSDGQMQTPLPLEVTCANVSCRHIFPALAAGADLCPECETGFAWDDRGQPLRVLCPGCRQDIGYYQPGRYTCFLCGCALNLDAAGIPSPPR